MVIIIISLLIYIPYYHRSRSQECLQPHTSYVYHLSHQSNHLRSHLTSQEVLSHHAIPLSMEMSTQTGCHTLSGTPSWFQPELEHDSDNMSVTVRACGSEATCMYIWYTYIHVRQVTYIQSCMWSDCDRNKKQTNAFSEYIGLSQVYYLCCTDTLCQQDLSAIVCQSVQ